MSELKPCPFCGSDPKFTLDDGDGGSWVTCTNDKCKVNPSAIWHAHDKETIVQHWNNRPESEAERVLREYGVSRLMSQNIYSLSANSRLRKAIDELNKLAIALAEGKAPKTQDELCAVCGIGSNLPSGMCDHCDSPARKLAGETTKKGE